MPTFTTVGHISFSVTDCDRTAQWWTRIFGFPKVYEIQHDTWRAILLELTAGTVIEFQQHDSNGGEAFDPTRTGFDHLGLHVASREELLRWQEHFETMGVTYTPVVDREYGSVLTFKDPDRIQFEMFYLNPALG
jgi:glyoxylase I family protein